MWEGVFIPATHHKRLRRGQETSRTCLVKGYAVHEASRSRARSYEENLWPLQHGNVIGTGRKHPTEHIAVKPILSAAPPC